MMTTESINIDLLPSIALNQRSCLPSTPAVYFCLNKDKEVLYIGKSLSLRQRWTASHHRFQQMKEIGDVSIAWLTVDSPNLLEELEEKMIARFTPKFNRINSSAPKVRKAGLKILRNTLKEFIDKRGITPYALSKRTSLPLNTIYRLVNDPYIIPKGKVMDVILNTFEDACLTDILERSR